MCSSGPREQRRGYGEGGRERGIAQETQDLFQNDGQTERSAKENKRGNERERRSTEKEGEGIMRKKKSHGGRSKKKKKIPNAATSKTKKTCNKRHEERDGQGRRRLLQPRGSPTC